MNFINTNLFILFFFTLLVSAEEATYSIQTLNGSLNINDKKESLFEDLKNHIRQDIELSIQSDNLMMNTELQICKEIILNVNNLKDNLDKAEVNLVIEKINICRDKGKEYRNNILYYKSLTKNIKLKNIKYSIYDEYTISLLLKGLINLKYYKLEDVKYNLENNNLIESLLIESKTESKRKILEILNKIELMYCQNKDRKHTISIVNSMSINIKSVNGVEY